MEGVNRTPGPDPAQALGRKHQFRSDEEDDFTIPDEQIQPLSGTLETVELKPFDEVFAMSQARSHYLSDKPFYEADDVRRMTTDLEYASENTYRLLVYSLFDTLDLWYAPDAVTDEKGNEMIEEFVAEGRIIDSSEFTKRILPETYRVAMEWISDGKIELGDGSFVELSLEPVEYDTFRDMIAWEKLSAKNRKGYLVDMGRIRDMEKDTSGPSDSEKSTYSQDTEYQRQIWKTGIEDFQQLSHHEKAAFVFMRDVMKFDGEKTTVKEGKKVGERIIARFKAGWKAEGIDVTDIAVIVESEALYQRGVFTIRNRMFSRSKIQWLDMKCGENCRLYVENAK